VDDCGWLRFCWFSVGVGWSGLLIPKHGFPLLCGSSFDQELTIRGPWFSVCYESMIISTDGKANCGIKHSFSNFALPIA
jgi:hypothetical protein